MTDMDRHDTPVDSVVYRHTETGDRVVYHGRQAGTYRFRINEEKTMNVRTENWPEYREYLVVEEQ